MRNSSRLAFVALAFALAKAPIAGAQAPAPTQNADRVAETAPSTDAQNWTASAGAVVNTGNTRSYSASVGTAFSITRGRNGFAFESAGNFGRAVPAGGSQYATNAKNLLSRARYDFFVSTRNALFASVAHRWDTFSGLDTRIQAQVGYQYNFIREEHHRLWTEVGYDFTFDNLVQTRDAVDPTIITPADDTTTYHSARAYFGWENQLNEHVQFKTGLEALFNVQVGQDWRLNWMNTFNAAVSSKLSLEIKFNVLYDNQPVQGFRPTDTRTTINLVLDMW